MKMWSAALLAALAAVVGKAQSDAKEMFQFDSERKSLEASVTELEATFGAGAASRPGRKTAWLPFVDGSMREFELVQDTSIMAPELAARFPSIVTYAGVEIVPEQSQAEPLQAVLTYSELGLSVEYWSASTGTIRLDPKRSAFNKDLVKLVFRGLRDENSVRETHDLSKDTPRYKRRTVGGPSVDEIHKLFLGKTARKTARRKLQDAISQDVPGLEECPAYLVATLGDRVCNPAANTAECAFDAGDCCSIYALCASDNASDCKCVDPNANKVRHRRFRLAIAASEDYCAMYDSDTGAILSSIVSVLARVNGIFKRELALSYQLVDGTETLFDCNGTLGLLDSPDGGFITQGLVDGRIGEDNYDLAHLFGTSGGGIAGNIGSVCNPGAKAQGYSNMGTFENPEKLLAHELGHEMGADHTMASCGGGNTPDRGVEAGGGTSIMSYQAICGDDDVDTDIEREFYFYHSSSLEQINAYMSNPRLGGRCGTIVDPDEVLERPAFESDLDFDDGCEVPERVCRIPVRTPFRLEGHRAKLADDSIFYSWEQTDIAKRGEYNSINVGQTKNSVLFSSVNPKRNDAVRVFPRMETVRRGMDIVETRERLPTVARNMTFTMLARTSFKRFLSDGTPGLPTVGATFTGDKIRVEVVDTAPLRVTRVETPTGSIRSNERFNVEWTGGAIADRVRISLSTDDGLSFPIVLARNVSNTGSAEVSAALGPELCGLGLVRIKIESEDELDGCSFFAISDNRLNIVGCDVTSSPPPVSDWPYLLSDDVATPPTQPVFEPTSERVQFSGNGTFYDSGSNAGTITNYEIVVAPGQQAAIAFLDMSLACCGAAVKVYDGLDTSDPTKVIASYTKAYAGVRHRVIASSNAITVRYEKLYPGSPGEDGIQVIYDTDANLTLPAPTPSLPPTMPPVYVPPEPVYYQLGPEPGVFSDDMGAAPFWEPYPNDLYAEYAITVDDNLYAAVRFDAFELETCCDYVNIFDGVSGQVIARDLNGANLPGNSTVYTSMSNQMRIVFTTDGSVTYAGFRGVFFGADSPGSASPTSAPSGGPEPVYYQLGPEPGIFSDDMGAAPFWEPYPDNHYAEYNITVDDNLYAAVRFDAFELETCCDYVNIFDGVSGQVIARDLNGANLPGNDTVYASTSNQMRIVFTTDGSVTYAGFRGSFFGVAEPGTLAPTSPPNTAPTFQPSGPPSSDYLYFELGPSPGNFSDDMGAAPFWEPYPDGLYAEYNITVDDDLYAAVQFYDFELESCCDYVNIFDGVSGQIIAQQLNGANRPGNNTVYASASNKMRIVFTTDGSVTFAGFRGSFFGVTAPGTVPPTPSPTEPIVYEVGPLPGNFSDDMGAAPFFVPYNRGLYGIVVRTPPGTFAAVQFDDFDVGPGDVGYVFDTKANFPEAYLLEPISGYRPFPLSTVFIARDSELVIVLNASSTTSPGAGFRGRYFASGTAAPTVPTTSPTATPTSDFTNTPTVSGGDTDGNFTLIELLPGESLTFTDDNRPVNETRYFNYQDKTWEIVTAEGENVELQFGFFDVEGGYDFVYIYDGTRDDPRIATLTNGGAEPGSQVFRSTGNVLTVRLTTDYVVTRQGFEAFVKSTGFAQSAAPTVSPTPGPTSSTGVTAAPTSHTPLPPSQDFSIYGRRGNFSNNFPLPASNDPYGAFEDKTWVIYLDEGSVDEGVAIDVWPLDLEEGFDWLTIYDGVTGRIMASLTGRQYFGAIKVYSPIVVVRFTTDGVGSASGFEASWSPFPLPPRDSADRQALEIAVDTVVPFNLTELPQSGAVQLVAPANKRVELDLDMLQIVSGSIKLYDGPDADSPLLRVLTAGDDAVPLPTKSSLNEMFVVLDIVSGRESIGSGVVRPSDEPRPTVLCKRSNSTEDGPPTPPTPPPPTGSGNDKDKAEGSSSLALGLGLGGGALFLAAAAAMVVHHRRKQQQMFQVDDDPEHAVVAKEIGGLASSNPSYGSSA